MSCYEFDETDHPLRLSCYVLPSFDGETTEIDIPLDEHERLSIAGVPEANIERIGMPRISMDMPEYAREPFEQGIGLGIVACRILSREDDNVTIELPTVPETIVITVSVNRLARKR